MSDYQVGDKGIILNEGSDFQAYIPYTKPNIGDKAYIYTMRNGMKIAIPVLEFELGNPMWMSPDMPMAGFDWKVDFNFNLIPLGIPLPCVSTITAVGTDYLEDNTKAWANDELIGKKLWILSGLHKDQKYDISDNDTTKYYPVLTSAFDLDFESGAFGTWVVYPNWSYQVPVFDNSTKKHGSYSIKCQVSGSNLIQYSGIRQVGDFSAVAKIGIWWLGQIDKHTSPGNGPYMGDLDISICGNWHLLDEWVVNGAVEQNPDYPNFSYFEFSISGLTTLSFLLNRNGGTKNGFINIDYIQLFDSNGNLIENLLEDFTVGDRYVIWDPVEARPYCGYAARLTGVGSSYIEDGYRSWSTDELADYQIEMLTGPNGGSRFNITSNTRTKITLSSTAGFEVGNWYKIWDPVNSCYVPIG